MRCLLHMYTVVYTTAGCVTDSFPMGVFILNDIFLLLLIKLLSCLHMWVELYVSWVRVVLDQCVSSSNLIPISCVEKATWHKFSSCCNTDYRLCICLLYNKSMMKHRLILYYKNIFTTWITWVHSLISYLYPSATCSFLNAIWDCKCLV